MKKLDSRYQFQPWYVKLWRWRFYIKVPFQWLRIGWHSVLLNKDFGEWGPESRWSKAKLGWNILKGIAQGDDMEYYYTWEEVKERLDFGKEDED